MLFDFDDIKIESGELVYSTSSTLGTSNVTLIDILDLEIENNPDLIYNGTNWQIYVIEKFLPQQMSAEELKTEIAAIIASVGATSPADMGKVMGVASKQFAGKADGKTISAVVKELLAR